MGYGLTLLTSPLSVLMAEHYKTKGYITKDYSAFNNAVGGMSGFVIEFFHDGYANKLFMVFKDKEGDVWDNIYKAKLKFKEIGQMYVELQKEDYSGEEERLQAQMEEIKKVLKSAVKRWKKNLNPNLGGEYCQEKQLYEVFYWLLKYDEGIFQIN